MAGVTEQQLRNLEVDGATRSTGPGDVRLSTALEILRVYWPDVSLDAFVDHVTLFRIQAKNRTAARRLKGYATSKKGAAAA
jgi:hypothetical protein